MFRKVQSSNTKQDTTKSIIKLADCVDDNDLIIVNKSTTFNDQSSLTNSNYRVLTPTKTKVTLAQCVDNASPIKFETNVIRLKNKLEDSRKECRRLKSQVYRLTRKLATIKEENDRMSKPSRSHAVRYIKDHLSGIKKDFVLAQIQEEYSRNGRRWSYEMIRFAGLLYNLNKHSYSVISSQLTLPHKRTLSRQLGKCASKSPSESDLLTQQLVEQMKVKRSATGEIVDDPSTSSGDVLDRINQLMNLDADDTLLCSEM
ncbi:hypothetical protein CHUAL_012637 [Chamberlinius hualienensis]